MSWPAEDQESRLQEELARSLAENERLRRCEASGWMLGKSLSQKEKLEAGNAEDSGIQSGTERQNSAGFRMSSQAERLKKQS